MIDFSEMISDKSLSAFIDGNASPFESMKIESSISSSGKLSEVMDIVNSSKELDDFSEFTNDFESLDINELIEKINNTKIR